MIRINQLTLPLDKELSFLLDKAADKLRIPKEQIQELRIVKESVDARKHDVRFRYSVDVVVPDEERFLRFNDVVLAPDMTYVYPKMGALQRKHPIIVVGFGPAGMFAALLLAQMGYCPLVLERGGDVDERVCKVEAFWKDGSLDESCNVQFGEGGAGTFSDGKLTTRSKDLRSFKVLEEFVKFGAPKEILYEAHPHIGTDLLRDIVKRMRKEIIALGGEVRFHAQMDEIQVENNKITAVKVKDAWLPCDAVVLAIGHSARDSFAMLAQKNITMEAKSFAVGVRIEHPQVLVNQAQYKEFATHPKLKAAEYRLTHTTTSGRGVYTFCMCPGGSVVASASSQGKLVINGMSEHARDKENANSAILVQVHPSDYGENILDGVKFQEALEKKAFEIGGGNYHAPAQLVKDFLSHQPSFSIGCVQPSYLPGVTLTNLHDIFPEYIQDALREGILAFDRKLKGFAMEDAIMTGVETRSSSPIRISRNTDSLASVCVDNLYPCGEGAGYAGGIVSAAIDGLRCGEKIIEQYKK